MEITREEVADLFCMTPKSVYYLMRKLGYGTDKIYNREDVIKVHAMRRTLRAYPEKIYFRVPPAIKNDVRKLVKSMVAEYKKSLLNWLQKSMKSLHNSHFFSSIASYDDESLN